MSRKLHREGEKIKRIAHTPAAGLVPFGDFLRTSLTRATRDCVHGFTRQTGEHRDGCPTCYDGTTGAAA